MGKLYIAYGSNLNINQMALRCPTARVYGAGILNNWELLFRGNARGCGVATVQRRIGSTVPVGLWEIEKEDEKNLDIYEGYPRLYDKQNVYVTMPDGSKKKAMIYIMTSGHWPTGPSSSYENTIRIGYDDFGLDISIFDEAIEKNCTELQRRPRPFRLR